FDHMAKGKPKDVATAERLYQKVLPLLILLMESMDTFLVYGKPVLAHRLGIAETSPRLPSTPATKFGLAAARRYAEALGRLQAAIAERRTASVPPRPAQCRDRAYQEWRRDHPSAETSPPPASG